MDAADATARLLERIDHTAAWRESKAEQYPDDERNWRSARALRQAQSDIAALPDDDPRLLHLARIYGTNGTATIAPETRRQVIARHGFDSADAPVVRAYPCTAFGYSTGTTRSELLVLYAVDFCELEPIVLGKREDDALNLRARITRREFPDLSRVGLTAEVSGDSQCHRGLHSLVLLLHERAGSGQPLSDGPGLNTLGVSGRLRGLPHRLPLRLPK